MCEEESTHGIVRISIRFGILVMDTMITCPMVNRSLIGNRVTQHEEESDGEGSAVGSMRPKSVHTNGDSKSTVVIDKIRESDGNYK